MTPPVEPRTPAERVAEAVARYGGPGDEQDLLVRQTLERLGWRERNSGRECRRCGRVLPVAAYSKDSREPDGLNRTCRECHRERRRRRREQREDAPTP